MGKGWAYGHKHIPMPWKPTVSCSALFCATEMAAIKSTVCKTSFEEIKLVKKLQHCGNCV